MPRFLSGVVKNSLPHCGIKTVEIWAGEIIFLHLDGKNRNFPGEMGKIDETGENFLVKGGKCRYNGGEREKRNDPETIDPEI